MANLWVVGHCGRVDLDRSLIDDLDAALNESNVCGMLLEPTLAVVRLLIEVAALPEVGAIDPDGRRALALSGVSSVELLLSQDGPGPERPIPLDSMSAVERFFSSLWFSHSMYGWSFIDMQDRIKPWPSDVSLRIELASEHAQHSLEWFAECGLEDVHPLYGPGPFVLRGLIRFQQLAIERADGTLMTNRTFADDGLRWWRAFKTHDPRVNVDAQREHGAHAKYWRPPARRGPLVMPSQSGARSTDQTSSSPS
jgi:hypothetical protein